MCPSCAPTFRPTARCSASSKNAWDDRRTAGGSTGGGAVAVAARLSPLELGSDIGGSVRNPAHYNGIFSLKPTEWRVPGRGHVPNLPGQTRTGRWMGVFGPLARSVEDLETALRIIDGPDGYDAEGAPVPLGPAPAAKPKDLRIAFIDSNPLVKVSADTASVVQQTVRLLSKAGAKVKRAEPRGSTGGRAGTTGPISSSTRCALAAAGRARAHVRDGQCVRPDRALGRPHGAARSSASFSPCSTGATGSCGNASPSSTTTTPG